MAECKVLKCNCTNSFQDELYGKGMRVFNPQGKGSDQGNKYICTVCHACYGGSETKKKK